MILPALAFVAGVWLLQQQSVLPSLLWTYPLAGAGFAAALARGMEPAGARRAARLALPVLGLAAGFVWAGLWAHLRLADALVPEWEGRDVRLIGVVADLPNRDARGTRMRFDVERVATPSARIPRRIALTWYADAAGVPDLRPGQRWALNVRLRKPHGTANPHGFDFEVWMLERGIRATGYVRAADGNRLLAQMVHRPGYWIERLREGARARIAAAVQREPGAGVLIALAIGDQPAIASAQWTVFTRTGVNHLMSISGLHITMVSALVFGAVLWLWRRLPRLAARLAAQRAAAAAGLAAAVLYALLAGWGVPAQRTVYMLAVLSIALWIGRGTSPLQVLALALLAVLALDPWAVLSPGFWLSFGAVALIMYVSAGRIGRPGWLLNWARVQWAITLGITPLLIGLFQQVSLVSPLANAVAIPVVSLGVVPLTLIGLVLPFDFVLWLAAKIMLLLSGFLEALSRLPDAVWQQHAPPRWAVPLALLGVVWLLAPRGFPGRWVGAAAFLPLLFVLPARPPVGEAWIDVLDVGQGQAVLVRTARHALLYDAGPSWSGDADSGSRIVVPHLRASGVVRVDAFVVSHADSDHAGGMASVLQALPVERVIASLPSDDSRLALVARHERCVAGQRWEWDGVGFAMLHPRADSYNSPGGTKRATRDNDLSCVLRVTAAGGSALFTGDIEQRSERDLLQRAAAELRADVLLAPHHGSATSSSDAFLRQVQPEIAVFSVGYRNRFGHPAPAVLERYLDVGSRVYRSDADGAVRVRIGAGVSVDAWRQTRPRYWQGR